jgi:hypothetical protein
MLLSRRVSLRLIDNKLAGTTTGWMTSGMFVWFGWVLLEAAVMVALRRQGMFSNDTEWSVVVLSRRVLLWLKYNLLEGTTIGWMTSGMFVWISWVLLEAAVMVELQRQGMFFNDTKWSVMV